MERQGTTTAPRRPNLVMARKSHPSPALAGRRALPVTRWRICREQRSLADPAMTYARAATRRLELDRATLLFAGPSRSRGFGPLQKGQPRRRGRGSRHGARCLARDGSALAGGRRLLICVMLFVPVGRYSIPINLPFGLELYRLAVAVVLAAWVGSLCSSTRVFGCVEALFRLRC